MFLKNKNIIFKIRTSKVTDYAALKAIIEVCGKIVIGLGPKEEYQTCFAGYVYLGCYVCDLLYIFDTLFCFSKSYIDFSLQQVHLFKTKFIQTAEKEPY